MCIRMSGPFVVASMDETAWDGPTPDSATSPAQRFARHVENFIYVGQICSGSLKPGTAQHEKARGTYVGVRAPVPIAKLPKALQRSHSCMIAPHLPSA